jgi:hypothetical protein
MNIAEVEAQMRIWPPMAMTKFLATRVLLVGVAVVAVAGAGTCSIVGSGVAPAGSVCGTFEGLAMTVAATDADSDIWGS